MSKRTVASPILCSKRRRKTPSRQPRELPWSWERSPGWRGQYDRVRRWCAQIFEASPDNVDELFDFILAFFTACYHLRDWLAREDPGIQGDLDKLFAASVPLRLGADIANIAKHFDLTHPPRAERQLSFAREYVSGGAGWFGRDARLIVLSRGEKVDVLDLVVRCESAWTDFLEASRRL